MVKGLVRTTDKFWEVFHTIIREIGAVVEEWSEQRNQLGFSD
jgi:hypothetical protein